jgi:hypothetical protein
MLYEPTRKTCARSVRDELSGARRLAMQLCRQQRAVHQERCYPEGHGYRGDEPEVHLARMAQRDFELIAEDGGCKRAR